MKKKYTVLKIEIAFLNGKDILTASIDRVSEDTWTE